MGWTKRDFVLQGFREAGLASYVFRLTADQLQNALIQLDTMMATWNAVGVRCGYPLPSSPGNSNLDEETNVQDAAYETIYQNLAIRIAPGFGKTVSPDTKISAFNGYNALLTNCLTNNMPVMQLPSTMPAGAGNKPWRNYNGPFIRPPVDPIDAGADGPIEFD